MKKVGQWLQVQIVLSFSSLLKSPSHKFILSHCSGKQPPLSWPILQVETQIIIGSNGPKLQSQAYNGADPRPLLGIATVFYFIFLVCNCHLTPKNNRTVLQY
jgi:hypothetical protein